MELSTRRELMRALLGGAVAASCARKIPTIGWDGTFVNELANEGHKIRDGHSFISPEEAKKLPAQEIPVLILGGGVAGLVAGWGLSKEGLKDFLLLEMADTVGGTARAGQSKVSAYPWGAHYLPAPHKSNPDLLELLRETKSIIGSDAQGRPTYEELHLCAAPKERVYYDGLWYPGLYPPTGASAADLTELRRFSSIIRDHVAYRDKDGRRAFSLPAAHSSDDPQLKALDEMSMSQWLARHNFESPRLRWYVDYACRDDFGAEASTSSAWSTLHYYCARTERPEQDSSEYLTWPEGNAFLTEHLAARIGRAKMRTGRMVVRVQPREDGRVEVLAYDRGSKRMERYVAQRAIFALPSFLRSRLLKGFSGLPNYETSYAPWLVANIHLSGWPGYRGSYMAWDNVIYDSESLGYVVATHQGDGMPPPKTVWTYYLPFARGDAKTARRSLYGLSWSEAADAVVADLDRCHVGFRKLVRKVDIMRWGHGMVAPRPGVAFSKERLAAQGPVAGLHFAHTDLSGVALFEEAFYQGLRAAREVIAARPSALKSSGGTP